ncbi:hypothetical protein ABC855_g3099 [[Candida] zeylanoides]
MRTFLLAWLAAVCAGYAIGGLDKRDSLETLRLVKDLTKRRLVDHLTRDSHIRTGIEGQSEKSEHSDGSEEEDESEEEEEEEEKEEKEVFSQENPRQRYNAGKTSQLKAAHQDMGISGFEVQTASGYELE